MKLKSININGEEVWPFFVTSEEYPEPKIYVFGGSCEDVMKNFPRIKPKAILAIAVLDFDQVNAARYNIDVMTDTDLINLRPLDSTGHIWEVNPDDPVSIIDPVTGIEILRASDDYYAANNAKLAATAKDAISILQGIYYRLHAFHFVSIQQPASRNLLEYLLRTLKKAGINNVMDFEFDKEE